MLNVVWNVATPFFPSGLRTVYPDSYLGAISAIALLNAPIIGLYSFSGKSGPVPLKNAPSFRRGKRMPCIFLYSGFTRSKTTGSLSNNSSNLLTPIVYSFLLAIALKLPEYYYVRMLSLGRSIAEQKYSLSQTRRAKIHRST